MLALVIALVVNVGGALQRPTYSDEYIAEANARLAEDRAQEVAAAAAERDAADEARRTRVALPADRALRVLTLGDSLSAGSYTSAPELSWTSIITASVAETTGREVEASVVATSGQTTGDALSRPIPGGQDLVIVELGTNDVGRATPPEEFAGNYRALIGAIRAGSPDARIICVTPWNNAERSEAHTTQMEAACQDVDARVTDIAPIYQRSDTRAHKGEMYFGGMVPDDAHPNDAGHRAIADLVLAWLVVE